MGGVGYFVWQKNSEPADSNGSGGFSFKNFFPFGNNEEEIDNTDNPTNTNTGTGTDGGGSANNNQNQQLQNPSSLPKLRKISDGPVAGAVMLGAGTTTIVRFVEKATGNIYEARSNSASPRRLTNTTIPKIVRAYWLPQGDGLLAQTVSEDDIIETSFLRLTPAKATTTEVSVPYEVVISKLPTGIQEISIRPDGKQIVYYTKENGSAWYTANPDGTGRKNIYQNPITGWVPQWYSQNSILISTKATYLAQSYGYILSPSGGRPTNVYTGEFGTSAKMSPNGKTLLLTGGEDKPVMHALSVADGSQLSIGSYTFSEKCAWDPSDSNYIVCGIPQSLTNGGYPDNWYKGKLSTNDLIERVNVNDNVVFIASNPAKDIDREIDVKEMYVSKNGQYAAFLDKSDSALWLLRLKE